ncbi:MAG: helix-turn-helix domain-containing protein [Desulfobacterales bacterium]
MKGKTESDSMKAKILTAARKIFSEYGFHGTTTRMIAKAVKIDISTLYYHWGKRAICMRRSLWM